MKQKKKKKKNRYSYFLCAVYLLQISKFNKQTKRRKKKRIRKHARKVRIVLKQDARMDKVVVGDVCVSVRKLSLFNSSTANFKN